MDPRIAESIRERTRRPVRSKRYSRLSYAEEKRPPKRLFTPEIKRFLKDWLIRRRDNPYPNRDEKKSLAVQTGLTYIQVCNWFANWRRKLKNSGKQSHRKSWGHLIKTYNNQVHGNVEHFSICSEDSIWQELDNHEARNGLLSAKFVDNDGYKKTKFSSFSFGYERKGEDHYRRSSSNNNNNNNNNNHSSDSCYYSADVEDSPNPFAQSKYKNQIIEKYLRDCQKPDETTDKQEQEQKQEENEEDANRSSMISKWLESAVNFKPSESSYLSWTLAKSEKRIKAQKKPIKDNKAHAVQQHGKEELDAAVALTSLANAHSVA